MWVKEVLRFIRVGTKCLIIVPILSHLVIPVKAGTVHRQIQLWTPKQRPFWALPQPIKRYSHGIVWRINFFWKPGNSLLDNLPTFPDTVQHILYRTVLLGPWTSKTCGWQLTAPFRFYNTALISWPFSYKKLFQIPFLVWFSNKGNLPVVYPRMFIRIVGFRANATEQWFDGKYGQSSVSQ